MEKNVWEIRKIGGFPYSCFREVYGIRLLIVKSHTVFQRICMGIEDFI